VRPRPDRACATGVREVTRPKKVLVVDDQAPLRLLYRVNLEPEGISVVAATDGRSGLECAARDSPDLILLDTEMPGLVGWQVAAALRADDATRAFPFVFVTARAKYRDRLRGLELGAVDYITLPTNPVTLAAHVRSLLEQTPEELEALRRQRLAEVRAAIAADPDGPDDSPAFPATFYYERWRRRRHRRGGWPRFPRGS
jgi:DNA-binding response OmpR family regulator